MAEVLQIQQTEPYIWMGKGTSTGYEALQPPGNPTFLAALFQKSINTQLADFQQGIIKGRCNAES